jgi:LuxR family maltose regulon positive regulatory protein
LLPVRRPRLLAALDQAGAVPFIVLVAPAGYGKTTLLSEWCARDPRPSAWVTLERRHDDPLLLLRAIARAVEGAAGAPGGRMVLVLDDVQTVRSRPARETLAEIARHPPEGMSIALASRAEVPLAVARLRAQNLVAELRATDLAMTRGEAAALFRDAGLVLDGERLDELMHRTEGWPVALSLAAQALSRGGALSRFDGGDRAIAEFLRDEVLAGLDPGERDFVCRTAILDELSAPLCDAVLTRSGSGAMIAGLERSGFPLVTLDRTGGRRRHHRLVAELLAGELRRTDPGVEAALHRRASDWHAAAGSLEAALRHALAAGDAARSGALVRAGVPDAVERGAIATMERRLARLTADQIAAHPWLALAAAGTSLANGEGDQAECWVHAAASSAPDDGWVAALRAALGRGDLADVHAAAERASGLLAPESPGQALCRLVAGAAGHLRGECAAGRAALEDGARRAAVRAPHLQALCLAQLALLALDEHDPEGAARQAARARAQVERHGRVAASALVLAVSALVCAGRGREEDAAHDLRDATELGEHLTDVAAWYELEVAVVLARAALRLGDAGAAGTHLSRARRLAGRVPDGHVLEAWLRSAEAAATRFGAAGPQAVLTAAELRTLRFLPTHLTFREIGEQTSVTANTVKTQVNAAYRKLGVRSRSDAVERARALGLLEA